MRILQRLKQIPTLKKDGALALTLSLLAGLAAFIIGFAVFFPDTVLQRKVQYEINRNFPGEVRTNNISYRFPLTLAADDVLVVTNDRSIPEFRFETVRISPHLASLIGSPGICFTAIAGEGIIKGTFLREGEFDIEIANYSFDEPVQGFSDLRLNGKIAAARIESHLQPSPDTNSTFSLQAADLSLDGTASTGLSVDRIKLGQLTLEMSGIGRNFSFDKARLAGGEIQAEATGRVVAGQTARSTRINIDLSIKPAGNLDSSVASLLEIIGSPAANGSRKLNISGTLSRPQVK